MEAAGAVVYGVNPAPAGSHRRFHDKLQLPFPLIADKGGRVARAFRAGFWLLVRRTVYVLAPDGTIALARRGAPPPEVLLGAMHE